SGRGRPLRFVGFFVWHDRLVEPPDLLVTGPARYGAATNERRSCALASTSARSKRSGGCWLRRHSSASSAWWGLIGSSRWPPGSALNARGPSGVISTTSRCEAPLPWVKRSPL